MELKKLCELRWVSLNNCFNYNYRYLKGFFSITQSHKIVIHYNQLTSLMTMILCLVPCIYNYYYGNFNKAGHLF